MSNPHWPVGTAIYGALTAGTALMAMLANGTASVHQDLAGQNDDEPFVVFNHQAAVTSYTLTDVSVEDMIWQVRAVTRGPSSAEAGTIVSEIDNVLNDASLTIGGYRQLMVRRTDSIHRVEVIDGERYTHHGHLYRIMVNPT